MLLLEGDNMRPVERIKEKYKKTKKKSLMVYLVLRILVLICLVLEIMKGNFNNAFLCLLSLLLFTIPTLLEDKFQIGLPSVLESIVYLFIFSAEILGEINNFYGHIPYWDTLLHTLNGFLAAGVGFSLIDLLNKNSKKISLSPLYVALVAFCFSMTIGVLWEFFEYGGDKFLKFDMQKDTVITSVSSVAMNPSGENKPVILDNIGKTLIYDTDGNLLYTVNDGYLDIGLNDTMKDLFVNFIGAVCFSIFAYIGLKNNRKSSVVKKFVPTKEKRKMAESVKNSLNK